MVTGVEPAPGFLDDLRNSGLPSGVGRGVDMANTSVCATLLNWNRMLRLLFLAAFLGGTLRAETVLVLPFFNHSKSANLDWIGEASPKPCVIRSLPKVCWCWIARTASKPTAACRSVRSGNHHASIIKIGESLDASTVVYGYYELLPAEAGKEQSKTRCASPREFSICSARARVRRSAN